MYKVYKVKKAPPSNNRDPNVKPYVDSSGEYIILEEEVGTDDDDEEEEEKKERKRMPFERMHSFVLIDACIVFFVFVAPCLLIWNPQKTDMKADTKCFMKMEYFKVGEGEVSLNNHPPAHLCASWSCMLCYHMPCRAILLPGLGLILMLCSHVLARVT